MCVVKDVDLEAMPTSIFLRSSSSTEISENIYLLISALPTEQSCLQYGVARICRVLAFDLRKYMNEISDT